SAGGCGGLRWLGLILDALQPRHAMEANPALGPFAELGGDIFGDENNLRGPPDELVLFRAGLGSYKREHGCAIGRGNRNPAVTGLKPGVADQTESKLVQVEPQAAILIANENGDVLKTEVGVLSVQAKSGTVHAMPRGTGIHPRDSNTKPECPRLFGPAPAAP